MLKPNIDPSVFVAKGAVVIGDVTIEKDCSIWYNAAIRCTEAPITIGEGSNVQDNAVIHVSHNCPVTIGSHVTIGHGAIIHGCTIEDNALIGMGAIILNGAKIGKNCIIAAGALVPQNKIIPDNSLVMGSPGKIIRQVTEDEILKNTQNAEEYIKGFSGYLHTDGYSGYNRLTGVTRCGCWAHLRRKFDEALPIGKASEANGSYAQQGIAYCNKLFQIEADLTDMSPEDRYNKRLELEKPVLEAFWSWLESFVPLRGSKLATAVTYARNQKPYLENYLLDGRCSISNNIAENAIRPFVTGRKNWLFADSTKGATASAAIYSIVETAKANGLDVFLYLEQLLMHRTHLGDLLHDEFLSVEVHHIQAGQSLVSHLGIEEAC